MNPDCLLSGCFSVALCYCWLCESLWPDIFRGWFFQSGEAQTLVGQALIEKLK